jgi:hypothetical protein
LQQDQPIFARDTKLDCRNALNTFCARLIRALKESDQIVGPLDSVPIRLRTRRTAQIFDPFLTQKTKWRLFDESEKEVSEPSNHRQSFK